MIDDWMRLYAVVHSPAGAVCLICWEPVGDSVLLQLVGAKTHQIMTPTVFQNCKQNIKLMMFFCSD